MRSNKNSIMMRSDNEKTCSKKMMRSEKEQIISDDIYTSLTYLENLNQIDTELPLYEIQCGNHKLITLIDDGDGALI